MVTADMHCHIFFPEPFVQTLQLLAEIFALDIKVEDTDIIYQDSKRPISKLSVRLP